MKLPSLPEVENIKNTNEAHLLNVMLVSLKPSDCPLWHMNMQ